MMDTETMERARAIWSYMSAESFVQNSDAIVICCSYDLRVCDHACQLINAGYAETLVISGKSGNWTRHLWNQPEAEIFYQKALVNGISENQILLETKATNFGENIRFSKQLIPYARTVTFVSKPNSLLRVKLVAQAQWPEVNALVSCPNISFPEEVSNIIGLWGVINEMVGDIERIQRYPEIGYQVNHDLPQEIIENWHYLVDQGFTEHLMPRKRRQNDTQQATPIGGS